MPDRLQFDHLRDPDSAYFPLHPPLSFLSRLLPRRCGFLLARAMDRLASSGVIGSRKTGARAMPELSISTDQIAFLIEKAREFDVKEAASDLDSGSNAADDGMIDVLEDNGRDPVE